MAGQQSGRPLLFRHVPDVDDVVNAAGNLSGDVTDPQSRPCPAFPHITAPDAPDDRLEYVGRGGAGINPRASGYAVDASNLWGPICRIERSSHHF